MKTKIIDGRVFFEYTVPEFTDANRKIYEEKFQELREQLRFLDEELQNSKHYFIQIAYGYYTNQEKTDIAKAALKRINANEV